MDLLHAMRDLGVADPAVDSTGEDAVRTVVLREIDNATVTGRPGRSRRTRLRVRILAGSTFGMAGIAAAVTVALSAATTPPAFAVIRHKDGSVSVRVNRRSGIAGANQKLAAMGAKQQVAAVGSYTYKAFTGPCTQAQLKTLQDPGSTSGNSGSGDSGTNSFYWYSGTTGSGNSGNSGNSGSGNSGSGNSGSGNSGSDAPVYCSQLVRVKADTPGSFTITPGAAGTNSGAASTGNSGSSESGNS